MLYDTIYRHDQALSPSGLETLPAALHALISAVDDCRRAGKPIALDPAVLLLVRNLATVAGRRTATADLRLACIADRSSVLASPALLQIAGHNVDGDPAAKRIFHRQARRALADLATTIGLETADTQIGSALGGDDEEGTSELRHPDIGIRVRPRGLLPDSEISFNRCRRGEPASKIHLAPISELLDGPAFLRRLSMTIGVLGTPLRVAA
ncbi:hypothetical protein [Sphingomonas sp. GM_Shp_2]|uniref:hypothetical protein n=1 Tax=Sphingomonas sp. GM_Shp_2 TaxID=2937380 RepID=UPI00226A1743|nr:hypothetical protein [Sphingomonas sp. GM_Shp_2]